MDNTKLSPVAQSPGDQRLLALWERTGDAWIGRLAHGQLPREGGATRDPGQVRQDWTSTALMRCYKDTGDAQVFALLFELNRDSFMQAVQVKLRRCGANLDPNDVLQEVFLNIYRYPHRFLAERPDSFRNWGHRIVRNTVLKFLKGHSRMARFCSLDEEIGDREDRSSRTPYRSALESESASLVDWAYLIYLNLYLLHFGRLSEKEQRALTMVEVDGSSYKEAASAIGIRLENLKMVIFRGRRKILRGMQRTLEDLTSSPPQPSPTSH
ncbi:MAG: RNA polymerase sigma factor [Planctomycetota bacterium]